MLMCDNKYCYNSSNISGCSLHFEELTECENYNLYKESVPAETLVIKGVSQPRVVAGEWRYRELKIAEKTDTDPNVYQFILDKNGTAVLFSDEFTRTDSSWARIKREQLTDMVEKLNSTK